MKQKLNQVFFILMIIFSFNFVYAGNGIQINSSDKGNSVSIGSDINITNGRANGSAYINASEFKAKIEENIQERERLREELKENVRGRNELKNEIRATIKDRIMKMGIPRVRVIVNNKNILFEKGENNSIYLRIGNFSAKTKLNISENLDENNRSELKVKLSSGRNAEIKIMPDTAAERALERLRLKVCNKSNNCSIELKEVPVRNELKLEYHLKAKRKAKIFGFIKTRMNVESEIDAETGEIIHIKKPWWAFIASEPEEE